MLILAEKPQPPNVNVYGLINWTRSPANGINGVAPAY